MIIVVLLVIPSKCVVVYYLNCVISKAFPLSAGQT